MVWMVAERAQAKKDGDTISTIKGLKAEVQALSDQKRVLLKGSETNRFDDLFQELKKAKAQAEAATRSAQALQELSDQLVKVSPSATDLKTPEGRAEAVRRQALGAMAEQVLKAGTDGKTSTEKAKQLRQELAALQQFKANVARSGGSPVDTIRDMAAQNESLQRQNVTLQGQVKNIQNELRRVGGRGTEKPACWASAVTGKPEYIFTVALGSESLRLEFNSLPHRDLDRTALPVSAIRTSEDLTVAEFRAMTRPLFDWSEQNNCRFFVVVVDKTEAFEKAEYKYKLRVVGEHFYYFENLERPSGASASAQAR